ncbi:MAG: DUF1846 domain-containing protein [Ruminococcaceae bacterium]|nr:DUF1846 domain-containing protein [Oscillospiraceae bacterium]
MQTLGFNNELYIRKQSAMIAERIADFGGKLYLEFGGKLFDDYHASRVLPGFAPDVKLQMLLEMADRVEVVIVISATDIENKKIRGDIGISYDADVLRLIDAFRDAGLYVGSIVINMYNGQRSAMLFKKRLESLGMKVYLHYPIEGYPLNVRHVVSPEGLGKNEYIETERPLVVVTAPGPGSGKMATCLSQLYHENLRGIKAGYAKYETFPIWNVPQSHPVNLAYEAATADLNDVNMIDPYHLEAYGVAAVNYNRDVESFPVLRAIFEKIYGRCPYQSPTDMGVNMAGFGIVDDEAVKKASREEIIRRYYKIQCDALKNGGNSAAVNKIELVMNQAGVTTDDRPVVAAALAKSAETGDKPAAALELPDGRIVTGKTSSLLGPSAAVLLNALKALSGIDEDTDVISHSVIEPIQELKTGVLGNHNPRLHSDEVLIALAISAGFNPHSAEAIKHLSDLRGCEAHSTVILAQSDDGVFRKLGVNMTCEPKYTTRKLYHKS